MEQVGMGEVPNKARDVAAHHEEHEEHDRQLRTSGHLHMSHEHQQRQAAAAAAAAFHISQPPNPISAIISPAPVHQSSMVLGDPFNVSRILLHQTDRIQVHSLFIGLKCNALFQVLLTRFVNACLFISNGSINNFLHAHIVHVCLSRKKSRREILFY